jgi:hypothetical protein
MARSLPTSLLSSVDLPAFGRPRITALRPEVVARPRRYVSAKTDTFASAASSLDDASDRVMNS